MEQLEGGWTKGKYILFKDVGKINPNAKTKKFEVRSLVTNHFLGYVKWVVQFRKYGFWPSANVPLEEKSLLEIIAFCRAKTAERREKWKPLPSHIGRHSKEYLAKRKSYFEKFPV